MWGRAARVVKYNIFDPIAKETYSSSGFGVFLLISFAKLTSVGGSTR
jgi:hypothetical protein